MPDTTGTEGERMADRCTASRMSGVLTRQRRHWCDRPEGHTGMHVANDEQGRPVYAWQPEPARA